MLPNQIKGGCESCDVMSSRDGPLFRLRGDPENRDVIFILGDDWSCIGLGIYTPTLICILATTDLILGLVYIRPLLVVFWSQLTLYWVGYLYTHCHL